MKNILLICFNLFYCLTFSQGEFIVEINKTTGVFTKTGPPIAGITFVYPDDGTFVENTGTFIFASAQVNHRLYSIAVGNDSIVDSAAINNIAAFQVDNNTGMLYGLHPDQPNNQKDFVSIDPVTGAYSQLGGPLPGSSFFSTYGDFSTYDKADQTYIFLDPANTLYSIRATDGTVLLNPPLMVSSGETLLNFAWSNYRGMLFGILQDNNLHKYFLVTIDTANGVIGRIGSGSTTGDGSGSIAIDEPDQQCIWLHHDSAGPGFHLITFDIGSGNVLYNVPVGPLAQGDNVYTLKYDNLRGKLYSIHWQFDTATAIASIAAADFNISPNPFSTQTTLRTNETLKNASLTIYNLFGQAVQQIDHLAGHTIVLQRNNLAAGLYFVQIAQNGKTFAADKLVITDN